MKEKFAAIRAILLTRSFVLFYESKQGEIQCKDNLTPNLVPPYSFAFLQSLRSIGFLVKVVRRPLGFPKESDCMEKN